MKKRFAYVRENKTEIFSNLLKKSSRHGSLNLTVLEKLRSKSSGEHLQANFPQITQYHMVVP